MLDVGYLTALLGGLFALISPCSSLLLPAFFGYAFAGRTRLLARTGAFYLGLAVVLVPLGAASSGLGSLLTLHRGPLILAAGWLVIALGLVQILGGGWSLGPAARAQQRLAGRGTWVSTVGLGAVYGLAGFCAGPILGAVLTVAAASGGALRGAVLLAVYALGMAAPLFVLAALWQRFDLGHRRWLRGREFAVGPLRLHTTSTLSGLLFVAVGTLFLLTDGTAGLLGVGSTTAQAAQATAGDVGSRVSDVVLLGALAVALGLVLVWRLRAARAGRR